MKKSLTVLIMSIMFIFLISCQSLNNNDDIQIDMTTQIIDERFSISVPTDYETTSSEYIEKYFVKDNSASIIVTKDINSSGYTSAIDYYTNAMQQYNDTFDSVEEISNTVTTINSKYNTYITEFNYQIFSQDDVIDMTCYAEYILTGDIIYIVTCSAPTDTYSIYREEFVQSASSVLIT